MRDPIERQDAIDAAKRVLGNREITRTMQTALYILPSAQPEIEERKEEPAQNVPKEDLISRKAAIEAILSRTNCKSVRDLYEYNAEHDLHMMWTGGIVDAIDMVIGVPSAEPDTDEWCTDCKEYDHERHCCPRWNRVIRETLKDAQQERKTGRWTQISPAGIYECSECAQMVMTKDIGCYRYCPNCGSFNGGENWESVR